MSTTQGDCDEEEAIASHESRCGIIFLGPAFCRSKFECKKKENFLTREDEILVSGIDFGYNLHTYT